MGSLTMTNHPVNGISMWVKQCHLHHPWLGMVSWYHLQKWWFSWGILHQYVYNLLSRFFFSLLTCRIKLANVGKLKNLPRAPPCSCGRLIYLDIDPKYGSEDVMGCQQKFAISIVLDGKSRKTSDSEHCFYHWIGFVRKIYRKPWFLPSNIGLSFTFSHHPILCFYSYTLDIIR